MKLLLDLQGAQGGSRHAGLGRYTRELALALAAGRGGHEVHVLLNGSMAEAADALEAEFAPLLGRWAIHRFVAPAGCAAGADPHHPLRRAAELIRAEAVRAVAPDMLHVGSPFEGWNEPLVTTWPDSMPRPATVATLHDLIPLSFPQQYLDGAWRDAGLVPWYARHVLELGRMDGLLCNSEATRQEGLHHLDLPPEALCSVGGGVSSRFNPGQGASPVEGRYVLCLGLNDIRKNEARLIQAFALLPAALREGLVLAVTGSVPDAHLQALAAEAGLPPGSLRHLGFVAEDALPALHAGAALFVMPSLAEGFGLPLAEAMAAGAPFCASDRGALPEVAGRADVLFNPEDPADMARVMGRILGDAAFARELSAYGPARAAELTWAAAAARAWAAMEGWAPPAGAPWRAPLPRLAMTGPLPPEPSGIADYSAELVPALARHYAITLVSGEKPRRGLLAGLPWMPVEGFAPHLWRFDRVLHQVGNSHLHHTQHALLLPRRPATTVLHDVGLPEYRRWAADGSGAALLAAIYRNQGYPALLAALGGDAGAVAQSLPLSAQVLEESAGVIVHSQAALGLLRDAYGQPALARTRVVPHLRRAQPLPDRLAARARLGLDAEGLVIVSFGACVPKKLPLPLVRALAASGLGAELVFAGDAQPGLPEVIDAEARAAGVARQVRVTGQLSRAAYEDWLAAADIAVQLRGRHQGESSGAVADAMAAGLACIVNAMGSLAELPSDAVLCLPAAPTVAELAEALALLGRDPARREALARVARAHVAHALAPRRIAEAYRAAIEADHEACAPLAVCKALQEGAISTAGRAELADALAASFPRPRQPRLWITAEGWSCARFSDLADGRRPEPVKLLDGEWHSDHAGLAEALGLERPAAADGRVTLLHGDMMMARGAGDSLLPEGIIIITEW
ncbi:glycosyltransferase [Rhodovarius crocodyli]|nr:glycosyltransferase [Rhodovarius crocodyli]